MRDDYTKTFDELVEVMHLAGYRVFLAASGTHGLYTDEEGSKVVSFQLSYGSPRFSGNYISKHCGTGWVIADMIFPTVNDLHKYFAQNPPRWATKGEAVRISTLNDQLKRYGESSGYVELTLDTRK